MPDIFVSDSTAIVERLVSGVRDIASTAIATRGRFSIALPGGSVAAQAFPSLAKLPVDWTCVHFFWCDERAVAPNDPESNFGAAEKLWLIPAAVPPTSIHRMRAEDADLDAAAEAYAAELTRTLQDDVLDVALLGMGPDGHIASLFPGHPLLSEESKLVAAITDAPKPPPRRLTLTMPTLANARLPIVVAFGASKADALAEAIQKEASRLPVARLLHRNPGALVLADQEAGAKLR